MTVGRQGKAKRANVAVYFTEECSTRHQLRQLLANKYTLHHETKYKSQALSNMLIANITFLAFHTH